MTKKTIFIAEDNPSNMKLVRDILTFQGYNLIEAVDGKEALDKILEFKNEINLILMDIQLPELNGLEIIKELHNDEIAKAIPVMVISAHAMEQDIQNAKKLGCLEYITKPINVPEFMKKISDFFC